MPVLFVSHSSTDEVAATALEAWLCNRGFTDIFVDHSQIAGGEKWAQALREAAGACRVVVCLVTPRWLASDECFGEFKAAWYMGKRIIPLLAVPPGHAAPSDRLAKVLAEDQGLDIAACMDQKGVLDLSRAPEVERRLEAGLRAAGALARIGLDPEAFAIDRKLRPTPFPGLGSFGDDDADAALFYGRGREIAEVLEALRQMRASSNRQPFIILGASGAGKSSLLKAGIIPRLRREAPAWLPLRAFRPGADPLLNFAEALARTLADFGRPEAHGVIRDRLYGVWLKARAFSGLTAEGLATLQAALEAEGRRLREASGRSTATILVSIDQAEELARGEGDSGDALADYLRAALAAADWHLAFTIRNDSFPELQSHHRFQYLEARGCDLRAIPVFRFESLVEAPAKRYGVTVDAALVEALIEDAPKNDALPLLAFALQRLWRQYAASGALTKDNYDRVGGLKGLIEDAAERALRGLGPDQDVALPPGPTPKRRHDIGAATFVPTLAQINDQGAVIRRIAPWNGFDDEQRELLERFDQWRLVVRKGGADGGTAEVAHEALFREWTQLKGWLEPERARLETLRSWQADAATWNRNGRSAAFLNHRDKRLAETVALAGIDAYRKRLGAVEFDYLAACRQADRLAGRRRRSVQAAFGLLTLGIVAHLAGWLDGPYGYLRECVNWFTVMRPYMLTQVRPYVLTAERERSLKPMDSFRECAKDCPEMIVVPAGEFMMGSPKTETGRHDDEGPQHKVTFAGAFAVSKFNVTFADWDACVAAGGCPAVSDSGMGRGTKPVVNVSWEEARQYAAWLSTMTGRTYRLLTEAEWEYAARGGTTAAYYWGDEIGTGNANCDGCGSAWDASQTAPVGSFNPNAFGLYDTAGNVWLWVEDCYHPDYKGAPSDGSAWIAGDCSRRVVRGGSWYDNPKDIRPARRNRYLSNYRDGYVGFLVGRMLTP